MARDKNIDPFACQPIIHMSYRPYFYAFNSFKRFCYSEVVFKYEVVGIAWSKYMKEQNPRKIVLVFMKAVVYRLNKTAVTSGKRIPWDSFRDSTHLLNRRADKKAVDEYLHGKTWTPHLNKT
ncbi:hypothetical protein DPMN_000335 [Dreissena polymorpha]|uniref:Uncharacterized protein n=1 Tax=Dreissena polymorpha TaxID=45954 RepID=A0A9D4MJF1_DREPO|nr:hypothetical protein DPMN_000335 [Dreissena polymorpha]